MADPKSGAHAPLEFVQTVHHLAELTTLAARLVPHLAGGMSVGLVGPLGAGKTTFVRALVEAFGIAESVSSPTYILEHRYRSASRTVAHWDLYRIAALPEELYDPPEADTVRIIEWIDRFPALLAEANVLITIRIVGHEGEGREFTVSFLQGTAALS